MWIKLAVLLSAYHITFGAKMRCYRDSFTNFTEADLSKPDGLVSGDNPCIDVNRCTVIGAFGFKHDVDKGPAITALMTTYIAQKKCNVLLVNWEEEAGDLGLNVLGFLLNALPNSKNVGVILGKAIVRLIALGLSGLIHLVGHSLGAHLLCYAAREAKKSNVTIPHMTALDPSRLGYVQPTIYQRVDTSCAGFVDSVHTDLGGYALNISVGHVDFFLNRGRFTGGSKVQPGCAEYMPTFQDKATNGNLCNHDLSWKVYNISLSQEHLFLGAKASNYSDFVKQDGSSTDINTIGPAVDMTKRGDYYLTTMDQYPYGMGNEGLKP